MIRAGAVVRSLLAAVLLAIGLSAAPAAQAQEWSQPVGSPVDRLATVAETAHVLIFTETAAFRHTEAIQQGTPKIKAALEAAGVTSDVKDTADNFVFSDASLAPYDTRYKVVEA